MKANGSLFYSNYVKDNQEEYNMQQTTNTTTNRQETKDIALSILRGLLFVIRICGKLLWWSVKIGIAVACSLFDNECRFIAPRLITESFKPKDKQDYDQAWEDGIIAASMHDDEDD